MAELAEAGAVAFSDDGMPVASAGLMRRALQYASITGRPLALHCEEPRSRGRPRPRGRRRGRARLRRLSVGGRVGRRRAQPRARGLRGAAGARPPPVGGRVGRGAAPAREPGVAASGEVTPHHLVLTDEAVRSLDPNVKMNPPLRPSRIGSRCSRRCGTGRSRRSRPTTRRTPPTRRKCRSRRRRSASRGSRRRSPPSTRHLVEPGLLPLETLLERLSAGPARIFGLERPRIAVGARGEPRPARPRAGVARGRRAVPLALGQLLAARRDARRSGRADVASGSVARAGARSRDAA